MPEQEEATEAQVRYHQMMERHNSSVVGGTEAVEEAQYRDRREIELTEKILLGRKQKFSSSAEDQVFIYNYSHTSLSTGVHFWIPKSVGIEIN